MITISLENTDHGDLFVTVTDQNQQGAPVVYNGRLNEGQIDLLDIQEDGRGDGRITWRAQRVDKPLKTAERIATPSAADTVEITTFFG